VIEFRGEWAKTTVFLKKNIKTSNIIFMITPYFIFY